MLGQRRRRWLNIKTASDQCLVWVVFCNQFSGKESSNYKMFMRGTVKCRPRVAYWVQIDGIIISH